MNIKAHSNGFWGGAYMLMLVLWSAACGADKGDRKLAASLASDNTRQAAIASIIASGRDKVPLLLDWIKSPPKGVDRCGLDTGLEEAFGELKTKEAIPFLVENMSVYRGCFGTSLAPWLKAPEVIEWQLPAVGALIKIGPEASKAVMAAFPNMTGEEDRRAAVFVVSRIKGVTGAEPFLRAVSDRAGRERYWAEEGIKLVKANAGGEHQ